MLLEMSFINASGDDAMSYVRYPRAWLVIAGARIPVLRAEVSRTAVRKADAFSAEFSISESAKFGYGLPEWADWKADTEVSIEMATRPGATDRTVMVTGRIDKPSIPLREMTVSITGRDKSAKLIEKKRSQSFTNQRSSDIVATIAKDNGLNADITTTDDFAGKYYTNSPVNLTRNRSDFETLSLLADREGCRWYVEGNDLIYEPKDIDNGTLNIVWATPNQNTAYSVSNCMDLTLGKNSTAGRKTKVTFAGWHHGQKKLHKAVAQAGGDGEEIEYRFHHNGNDQAQLTKKAKSRLKDLIRHEMQISAVMPGDLTADPKMKASLRGTQTVFDMEYDIDKISWSFEAQSGLEMRVDAKSARPGRVDD